MQTNNTMIKITEVSKSFALKDKILSLALDHVNLSIDQGEFVCLLGPSGCGKTTLLNLIAGFDKPTTGTVTIHDTVVSKPSIGRISIFQNYGLLPWRSVIKNVELGLETKGIPREDRKKIAEEYLELVGLSDFSKHHPAELSGGMQQRVAIARALAINPEVLLMDEPFGALDAMTRMVIQDEIQKIWLQKAKTIVFVTHDIEEAVFLADRIVVMTPYPGKVKSIINVPLARKRDRTSVDFLKIRDRVFKEFKLTISNDIEYYL